jgi:hypothetical protein
MSKYIVMTSCAKMPAKVRHPYRNVAVVETDGLGIPAFIGEHARHCVRVVRYWGRLNTGTTPRCAYRVALAAAESIAAELNAAA